MKYLPAVITNTIAISALIISFYSLKLSIENHYIEKTQIIVGKRFEILTLSKQVYDINKEALRLVQEIIWKYNDNQKLLDKHKDRYEFWQKKKMS